MKEVGVGRRNISTTHIQMLLLIDGINATPDVVKKAVALTRIQLESPLANNSYRITKRLISTGGSSSRCCYLIHVRYFFSLGINNVLFSSQVSFKKRKKQCPDCHQWLSRKTIHPRSACSKYCIRNGISPPEIILSG